MALSVKTPPSYYIVSTRVSMVGLEVFTRGPATEAMPYMPPISPKKIGRLTRGTVLAIVTRAPVKIPADPSPATARPTMKAVEVGATPQTKEPSSKMNNATRKTHLML